jgi:hypothetical protein
MVLPPLRAENTPTNTCLKIQFIDALNTIALLKIQLADIYN